jgi:acyl-CoA synthetase (AMP-forming)/AMP-acid ligase II
VNEQIEEKRRQLREGNLPEALLTPATGTVAGLDRLALRERTAAVAGGLAQLGIRPGDRIGLYAANSTGWILAYLGALRAGAVLVPFNPAYREAEVEHILDDSDPVLVIADGERLFDGGAAQLREAVQREAPEAADADFETAFVAYLHHRGH